MAAVERRHCRRHRTVILVQIFVRRRFLGLRGEEHNDVIRFAFGVIGFVFAFFIGFVVSAMWGQINDADGRARIEGASGVQLASHLDVFDNPTATGYEAHCWSMRKPL
ncbi:hypothetical protein [Mycobacterium sp. 1274761.0]|uniref:bestrophin-like domain n=1 Tax=Mycobacterium sp. 1274761.0 TaxID=1834077 RepID=UPI0035108483